MIEILKKIKGTLNEPVYQVAFILFLFEAAFVPSFSHGDAASFCQWSIFTFEHGISKIYADVGLGFNYPVVIAYPLYVFGQIQGRVDNINHYFYFFKLFGLLADFIVAIVLVVTLKDRKREVFLLLFLIANPVFIYNSYCWGQVDGVLSMFVFLSFIFLLREKLVWSIIFFVLAVNFKVHAIIFLPALVLLAYHTLAGRITARTIIVAIAAFTLTQIGILLPFIINGQMGNVIQAITGSVDYHKCISCNAYNIWYYIAGKPLIRAWGHDDLSLAGMTYKKWGLVMFCIMSFITLLPLFISCISKLIKRNIYRIDTNSLFLVFALISLTFFFFNTQMHERFGHTTLIFVAAFAFSTSRYWLFLLVCIAYFGNMEAILHYFNFPNYNMLIFDPYWVASIYLLLILALTYFLYKPFIGQLKNRKKLSVNS